MRSASSSRASREMKASAWLITSWRCPAVKKDVVAFQIVTLGQSAADHVHDLQETEGITEAFYAHGLAVQFTEAAAKYTHDVIRKELRLDENCGKRYSWGFPALPDLSQHNCFSSYSPQKKSLGSA